MAIAYVQQATVNATTSPATTAAFGTATAAGQLVVVAVGNDSGGIASLGCTDSLGNTYTKIALPITGQVLEVWYSVLTTGGSGHTVSVSWSLAATGRTTVIAQVFSGFSGVGTNFDVAAGSVGTSASASSGTTAAPSSTSSLVISAVSDANTAAETMTLGPVLTHGLTTAGTSTDSGDSNYMNGTQITTTTGGRLSSISVNVGATIGASGNDQFQVALYSDAAGVPGTLIASSSSATLTASSWCTAAISATLAPSTNYWLMYNTNGTGATQNNLKYNTGGTSRISSASQTFGTWPSTFPASAAAAVTFSIYATYTEYSNLSTVAAAGASIAMASKVTNSQSAQTATMSLPTSQLWRCTCAVFKEVATASVSTRTSGFLIF